jgi:cell division protein FtsQ
VSFLKALAGFLPKRPKNRARVDKGRRWRLPDIQWARFGSTAIGVAGLLVLAGVIGYALNRPISRLDVVGSFQRVSQLDVEEIVRTRLRGGFITANLDQLQHAIEALPWVDHARVQRRWPDGVVVQVTEQSAAARWGETGLLNSRGELFIRDLHHIPPELPRLEGPEHSEHQVAELFFQLQPRLLEAGLRTSSLRLDARGAWELDLSSGVTVRFGRRQLEERIERFLKVGAPVVAGRPNDIAFLDMRYSNGFSVGWRTQGSPKARPATLEESPANRKRDQDA